MWGCSCQQCCFLSGRSRDCISALLKCFRLIFKFMTEICYYIKRHKIGRKIYTVVSKLWPFEIRCSVQQIGTGILEECCFHLQGTKQNLKSHVALLTICEKLSILFSIIKITHSKTAVKMLTNKSSVLPASAELLRTFFSSGDPEQLSQYSDTATGLDWGLI